MARLLYFHLALGPLRKVSLFAELRSGSCAMPTALVSVDLTTSGIGPETAMSRGGQRNVSRGALESLYCARAQVALLECAIDRAAVPKGCFAIALPPPRSATAGRTTSAVDTRGEYKVLSTMRPLSQRAQPAQWLQWFKARAGQVYNRAQSTKLTGAAWCARPKR